MRTATITIDGQEHLLCFSLRVTQACIERYGDVRKINDAILAEDLSTSMAESLWLLAQMMDGGARYAALQGIQTAPALSAEQLRELCDISDLSGIRGKIAETITNGRAMTVEAQPGKNGGAAQSAG